MITSAKIKRVKNLLKNISNFKMIFFMSSVSVYGKINKNKLDEKTKIFNPGLYGQSKLENEKIFKTKEMRTRYVSW